jgi:hypothetical protein
MAWVRARLCKLQKRCTRLAATSDKDYQLLAHGRWFSPASSNTKTGRHDIAEILLKNAFNTKKSNRFCYGWSLVACYKSKSFDTIRCNILICLCKRYLAAYTHPISTVYLYISCKLYKRDIISIIQSIKLFYT